MSSCATNSNASIAAIRKDLTFDHVIPRSRGGRTTWENVVTACSPCNLTKGGRMPSQAKMHPRIRPHQPSVIELREHGRKFPPNYLHESWADYLYWDSRAGAVGAARFVPTA